MDLQKNLKVDETIEKFKARLVIHGFKQKSVIDFFDNYALVESISTTRLFIAMASILNLIIHRMDMKTAFLNGDLDEEANVIIGTRIKYESNGIAISQSHYIEKYCMVIGCLMHDMTCTRPYIDFVVGKLSMYTNNPAAGKKAKWLKNLLLKIPLWSKPIAYIFVRCDSAATLAKVYSQMYNEKSRHLGVRHNTICELIMNGMEFVEFVRS
nr:zinc finger, CCHC-type [Tanacetum cinerariifolium]